MAQPRLVLVMMVLRGWLKVIRGGGGGGGGGGVGVWGGVNPC